MGKQKKKVLLYILSNSTVEEGLSFWKGVFSTFLSGFFHFAELLLRSKLYQDALPPKCKMWN